jgi:hypothetical protein
MPAELRSDGCDDLDLHLVGPEHLRRVFALEQQHDAFDRVRVAVLAEDATALLVPDLQLAEVTQQRPDGS